MLLSVLLVFHMFVDGYLLLNSTRFKFGRVNDATYILSRDVWIVEHGHVRFFFAFTSRGIAFCLLDLS